VAAGNALLLYIVYKAAIDSYEGAHHITRGQPNSVPTFSIFATFPAKYFGNWSGPFIDQVVGTASLVAFVFAVVDNLNQPVRANLAPLVIGFVVVAIGFLVRSQRRLRDQPGARLRATAVRLDRGVPGRSGAGGAAADYE